MEPNLLIDHRSPVAAKIRLFRSLFRGREDVYAHRFESRKTGKSGYTPACANEWVRGMCEKPRIKCAECPHRRFLPLTEDVTRWHLSGFDADDAPFVAGVYPLLPDETCWFLTIDFDKRGWREDVAACLETCRHLGLPVALERSRSGQGAHLWFFFDEPVPAALARRLGAHVLTETMERRPQVGLDSYDRLFPNQDTMPQGGFGSLIALPLQKSARDHGNSVFLDDDFEPWADQWAFLASLSRLSREQIERRVQEAERQGRVLGVRLPPQEDDEHEPWTAHRNGQIIVDECHHLSARSFEQVVRQARARFVVGLSATVTRKDGHHPIVFMQSGPIRHRVDARAQAAARPFEHTVLVQPTRFQSLKPPETDKRVEFQVLYRELIDDDSRTWRICKDVVDAVQAGRSPLVLTERNEHLDRLAQALTSCVRHVVILRAGMGRKQRKAASESLASIPRDEERVVISTGKYVGEGFDDPRLDTLFLATPVSWRGTIAQYAGRLHRLYDGKRQVLIYDYADVNVPMLARMFDRRCRGYEAIGYTVVLPASAIPGWPVDVILPADPVWKRDYSGSVRRLVRDGVDAPLAKLFLHVARTVQADAEGTDRARSATEAFLFQRLETLPETKGRFRLNERLPIAFDVFGALEVDLLCADARLAIELDGAQHLADPDAYRRDRRKDQLLQENGYFVLRFLAEDVGKELDRVLDAILRALARRQER